MDFESALNTAVRKAPAARQLKLKQPVTKAHKAAVYLGEHLLIEDPLFDDGYNAPAPIYPVDLKLMKRE